MVPLPLTLLVVKDKGGLESRPYASIRVSQKSDPVPNQLGDLCLLLSTAAEAELTNLLSIDGVGPI
jgi:hypothetical protein